MDNIKKDSSIIQVNQTNINNKKEEEDIYCLNYHANNRSIKRNFNSCPLIGLENIGATCYMNATLQCFCHIDKFIEFFKYDEQIINIVKNNKNYLSSSFKLLIEQLWPNNYNNRTTNNKYYAPEEFKAKISKMNPLFKGIAANDAKDLVNFIILTLQLELNKAKNIDSNDDYYSIDQSNKELVLETFYKDFNSTNQSIISDLFYAINCNITKCCNCKKEIYNYQVYFFLAFPLEEIRKYKISKMNNNNNSINVSNQINSNNQNIQNNFIQNNFTNFMNQSNQNMYTQNMYNQNMYTQNMYTQNMYNQNMLSQNMYNQNMYNNQSMLNNQNMLNNPSIANNLNMNINQNMVNQSSFNNQNNINYQNNINIQNNIINQNMIITQNNSNNQNINEVDLKDCFDYNQKENFMTGENSMYCNYCNKMSDSLMSLYLYTGPDVLILLLNRGKGIEFNVKINFQENLDLNDYIEKKDGNSYKLIGVISHLGDSSMSGHFIAYCRDPITDKWHKYNDAFVSEVNNFQKEVINYAMPYLLFYQKEK